MTLAKMYGKACPAGALITSAKGGIVTQIGMMKKKPKKPPTGTHRLIAVGTFTAGFAHSSAIEEIIPSALNVYAAGRSPMKNVKPPHPAKDLS